MRTCLFSNLLLIDKYTLCKYVTPVDFDITNKDIDIYVFKKAGQMCIIIWLILKYTDYCPTWKLFLTCINADDLSLCLRTITFNQGGILSCITCLGFGISSTEPHHLVPCMTSKGYRAAFKIVAARLAARGAFKIVAASIEAKS